MLLKKGYKEYLVTGCITFMISRDQSQKVFRIDEKLYPQTMFYLIYTTNRYFQGNKKKAKAEVA